MRRCSGPSAKRVVGLFLSGRQGAELPTRAHSNRKSRLLDFWRDGRLRETQRRSPVHHAITSADTDARVPVFQKPDDGVPDDGGDQAAEAGLDEDDNI